MGPDTNWPTFARLGWQVRFLNENSVDETANCLGSIFADAQQQVRAPWDLLEVRVRFLSQNRGDTRAPLRRFHGSDGIRKFLRSVT